MPPHSHLLLSAALCLVLPAPYSVWLLCRACGWIDMGTGLVVLAVVWTQWAADREPLSMMQRLSIALDVAEALKFMHSFTK